MNIYSIALTKEGEDKATVVYQDGDNLGDANSKFLERCTKEGFDINSYDNIKFNLMVREV